MHGLVLQHQLLQFFPSAVLQGSGFVAHAMQVERLHPDAVHLFANPFSFGCRFGFVEDGEGFQNEVVAVNLVILADVDAVVNVGLDEALAEVVVFLNIRCGLAVVALHEDVDERIDILIGVPKQLIDRPSLHFVELGSSRLILRFLENADSFVVAEDLDVWAEHLEVRPRCDVLGIIDDVAPVLPSPSGLS